MSFINRKSNKKSADKARGFSRSIASIGVLMSSTLIAFFSPQAFAETNIDVLVVYTDAAKNWANNVNKTSCENLSAETIAANNRVYSLTGAKHPCSTNSSLGRSSNKIANLIDIVISETNAVFNNSGIGHVNVNLAGAVKLENNGMAYDESPQDGHIEHAEPLAADLAKSSGVASQLYRLRNRLDDTDTDAVILNSVHELREIYSADLVLMLVDGERVEPSDGGPITEIPVPGFALSIGGLAMGIGVDDPRNGFAVLKINSAMAPTYTFAHELSHLFGANHYEFAKVPLIGPIDNINESPDFAQGVDGKYRMDNWAFINTVDSAGKPLKHMYSTIMSGVTNPVPETYDGQAVIGHTAWVGEYDGSACVYDNLTKPASGTYKVEITQLPAISSLSPAFPKAIQLGANAAGNETGCLNLELQLNDGSLATIAKKLMDTDSAIRNNARLVGKYAEIIQDFDRQLDAIVDQSVPAVAIDFGPATAVGWDVGKSHALYQSYDFRTHDEDCIFTSGSGCDNFWNNMTERSTGATLNLYNQDGESTGQTLQVVNKFQGDGHLPTTLGATYAAGRDGGHPMALTDYFSAKRLYTNPKVTISGLDNNKRYVFRVFGTTRKADSHRVANYHLTYKADSGSKVTTKKQLGTQGNVARFVEFTNVRPVNGKITLRVQPDVTVPFFQTVGLSAITYFTQP